MCLCSRTGGHQRGIDVYGLKGGKKYTGSVNKKRDIPMLHHDIAVHDHTHPRSHLQHCLLSVH